MSSNILLTVKAIGFASLVCGLFILHPSAALIGGGLWLMIGAGSRK